MTTEREAVCSTWESYSPSQTKSANSDDDMTIWRNRGEAYAARLLEQMQARDVMASLDSACRSLSTVDIDGAMAALADPDRARRQQAARRAFCEGALAVVAAAGGLAFGQATYEDVELGFAPARTADVDRRRC